MTAILILQVLISLYLGADSLGKLREAFEARSVGNNAVALTSLGGLVLDCAILFLIWRA